MERILLLLGCQQNLCLLVKLLENHYQVLLPNNQPLPEQIFDLCIVDNSNLEAQQQQLQATRKAQQPVDLPILLLTNHQELKRATAKFWQQVDDVLVTPIEEQELLLRVETLLRSRRLSLQLKVVNEQKTVHQLNQKSELMGKISDCEKTEVTQQESYTLLQKINQELTRSNTELEQFAYVASHDLREPLRKIKSYTELLADSYRGQLDVKADKYIDYIIDSAARMQNLISDLLSYSRVSRGELEKEPTDLEAILNQTLTDLSGVIEENQAVLIVEPLPTVQANPGQIGQLFQNLITNALKFRGKANPEIKIQARLQQNQWLIGVSDNGIGIKPQYSERIFQIFQRLHSRSKYPGTGIGLAICRKIIELHGGRMWVESEVGLGTTFYFTLLSKE